MGAAPHRIFVLVSDEWVRVKVLRWYAGWRLEIAPTAAKPTFVGWVLNLRRQVLLLLLRLAVAGLQKLDGHPYDSFCLTVSTPCVIFERVGRWLNGRAGAF